MNYFNTQGRTIYLFFLYTFFYFSQALTNPYVPINIPEAFVVVILALLAFYTVYYFSQDSNTKISANTKSTIQTVAVILLAALLFLRPIKFSALFNYYPNHYICIGLIVLFIAGIYFYSQKIAMNPAIPLIIFIPSLIKALIMSSPSTMGIYYKFPYLTTVLMIVGFLIYNQASKR